MFELFSLGRDLLNVPNVMKDVKDAQAKYPKDYPILNEIMQLLIAKYVTPIKIPGHLACIGDVPVSLWNQKVIGKCGAYVDPNRSIIEVTFVPTEFKFDRFPSNHDIEFITRATSMLQVGYMNVVFVRDKDDHIQGFEFAYTIRLSYDDTRRPGRALLSNMVSNALDAASFLPPAIEALQKGAAPEDAVKQMSGKVKPPPPPTLNQRKVLLDLLEECMSGYKLTKLPDQKGYDYYLEEDDKSLHHSIYISPLDKLVFLTTLNIEIPTQSLQKLTRFATLLNYNPPVFRMSNLVVSFHENRISFRTGVDARGIEDKFDYILISNLSRENIYAGKVVLLTLSQLFQGKSIREVLEKLLENLLFSDSQKHEDASIENDNQKLKDLLVEKMLDGFVTGSVGGIFRLQLDEES